MFASIIFSLFPIVSVKVSGNSMLPTHKTGEKLFVKKKWFFCNFKKGDIIVAYHPNMNKIIIKRLQEKKNDQFFLLGDNKEESTDSRAFGYVTRRKVIGKVISF